MSDLYSGTDLFSEFDRLQQQIAGLFGGFPSSIRSGRFGAFPQVNIGTTDDSIEIVAFAPTHQFRRTRRIDRQGPVDDQRRAQGSAAGV